MEMSSLAASAIATKTSQTRDGFQIAALKIANEQQQLIANMVTQSAESTKALNAQGVGGLVDVQA